MPTVRCFPARVVAVAALVMLSGWMLMAVHTNEARGPSLLSFVTRPVSSWDQRSTGAHSGVAFFGTRRVIHQSSVVAFEERQSESRDELNTEHHNERHSEPREDPHLKRHNKARNDSLKLPSEDHAAASRSERRSN
ncbi:hypothetical protein DIPPA_54307 [Diplonema papillatum]|nr:hypothetical protein DIPPA_54307 [Diplonema papillatum]